MKNEVCCLQRYLKLAAQTLTNAPIWREGVWIGCLTIGHKNLSNNLHPIGLWRNRSSGSTATDDLSSREPHLSNKMMRINLKLWIFTIWHCSNYQLECFFFCNCLKILVHTFQRIRKFLPMASGKITDGYNKEISISTSLNRVYCSWWPTSSLQDFSWLVLYKLEFLCFASNCNTRGGYTQSLNIHGSHDKPTTLKDNRVVQLPF